MSYSSNVSTTLQGNKSIRDEVHFIILAFLIIAVNVCVIMVIWRKTILHTWQNYLLVSLAFSDLSTGLFVIPFSLLCTLGGFPSTECIFCSISYILTKFVSISTILHLLAVTYERFLFIVYPFYHERLSAKHIHFKVGLFAIWTASVLVALIPFTWIDIECNDEDSARSWLIYTVITLIIFLVIPTILFIFAFISMFLVARVHIHRQERLLRRAGSQKRHGMTSIKEARVAIIFVLMWSTFVICWSPYFALNIIDELEVDVYISDTFLHAAHVLRFLTSIVNPFLYSFLKRDFCYALRYSCRETRICCCMPLDQRYNVRQEVPTHSQVAQRLSVTGQNAVNTQTSTF